MKTGIAIVITFVLAAIATGTVYFWNGQLPSGRPIKVGILHSLTGTMAISEKSVSDATLLAIEEINESGGLLGRRVEPVIADGESDGPTFRAEAERLIIEEEVSVVFGCWTSASRRTVKPVFEKHDRLLFYPVQYEGLEESPNIVYTGAAPSQQILPAVKWALDELQARRFFLVGSDYVFPHAANAIMKAQITAAGRRILGEEYVLLGSRVVKNVIDKILADKPDVILNTINGDSNVAFFKALRAAGITPDEVPTISFSIAEDELRRMDSRAMAGDYAAWNYFQSIDTEQNRQFVARFKQRYGDERVADDPMEAAYFAVYLWSQAVRDAGTDNVTAVRDKLANQSFKAPGGIVAIDRENRHTWKTVRIGRIRADGQFDVVWTSKKPIRPVPYPVYRSRAEWHAFLDGLYNQWGGRWANPGQGKNLMMSESPLPANSTGLPQRKKSTRSP